MNDISTLLKPKTEEKNPELLPEIHAIMEPHSESESSLRTIFNILSRHDYRLRIVARLLDAPYEKGVKVCGNEKIELEKRLQRSSVLHWRDITIHPKVVCL